MEAPVAFKSYRGSTLKCYVNKFKYSSSTRRQLTRRRGAAAPPLTQTCATHGGALFHRCLKELALVKDTFCPRIHERLGSQSALSPAWQWPFWNISCCTCRDQAHVKQDEAAIVFHALARWKTTQPTNENKMTDYALTNPGTKQSFLWWDHSISDWSVRIQGNDQYSHDCCFVFLCSDDILRY